MKVLIIEDDANNAALLKGLLNEHCTQVQLVGIAKNITEGLTMIATKQPQLVLLDIVLQDKTGFELLASIEHCNFEVVFVTGHNEYALQAIKCSALDYLLKPIHAAELVAAVAKAANKILKEQEMQAKLNNLSTLLNSHNKTEHRIALPLMKEIRFVQPADIIYCASNNSYTYFHLVGKEKIMVSKPIYEWDNLLQPYGFLRPNQSNLVNRSFIKSLLKEDSVVELLLTDTTRIHVSRLKQEMIKDALMRKG